MLTKVCVSGEGRGVGEMIKVGMQGRFFYERSKRLAQGIGSGQAEEKLILVR